MNPNFETVRPDETPMECGGKRSATPLSRRGDRPRSRACESAVAAPLCRRTPYVGGAALLLVLLACVAPAGAQPHVLVHNFSTALPSSAGIRATLQTNEVKVGLAAARLEYTLDAQRRSADLPFGEQPYTLSAGRVKVWVKGDGSTNTLQFVLRHAEMESDAKGRRAVRVSSLTLPGVPLDFTEWRELTLDATGIPEGRVAALERISISGKPGKAGEGMPMQGTIFLDDLRLFPAANAPAFAVSGGVFGPLVRDFDPAVSLFLDGRNFANQPVKLQMRIAMTDRNQNLVADRDFTLQLGARESKEVLLALKPDQLAAFLPPFKITGDIVSPDLPTLNERIEQTLVMGNATVLHADMGMLFSHWFTSGTMGANGAPIARDHRNWIYWAHGESQRGNPLTQTTTRLSRVEVGAEELKAAVAANPQAQPPGRLAMKLEYSGGEGVVYRGIDRFLAGNAYAVGVWVKGDGSKSDLYALFLDYTDLADFYTGGWKRIDHGERKVCTLDFTDWRYFRVELPGNGIGSNTLKGSSPDLDMPLELTAFRIYAGQSVEPGTVLLGPVYAETQVANAETLTAHVSYEDPGQAWAAGRNAWLTVHNGARLGSRKVEANWEVQDRQNRVVATGQFKFELGFGRAHETKIDLAAVASQLGAAAGPLRLKVTVVDTQDASVSATRAIALSKPDTVARVADFETPRGFLGLKAQGIKDAPGEGETDAQTTTEQAHSGKRSLALRWDKEKKPISLVSVDPPLPGQAVELSLWLYGDNSGVLFYPLLGDKRGVKHGLGNLQFDLFLPRVAGELQNAVRVDWTGWRQLQFQLPVVPPTWDQPLPILSFTPSYPLGLHLATDTRLVGTNLTNGVLYVDDVEVRTHAEPAARLSFDLVQAGEANVLAPGGRMRVRVANADTQPRTVRVTGGVFDWRGRRVAAPPAGDVTLAPGKPLEVALEPALNAGAFLVRLELQEGGKTVGTVEEDVIVGALEPLLGTNVVAALQDEWKLRGPLRDPITPLDEDWDWVEYHPGNFQPDTMRTRAARVRENGTEPWMLLGFSSYWAAGIGYERVKAGNFVRLFRHVGQGVDIFLIPQRLEDWENYVREVMRSMGRDVGGFVLWDNPDGTSTLAMPPEKFVKFLQVTDKWRRAYCPQTPLIIGGMNRATALPYLAELKKLGALDTFGGVNVRLDAGRMSPEDFEVTRFARELSDLINPPGKREKVLYFTELDWAVETTRDGLNVFEQAGYLVRTDLLLRSLGVRPALSMHNGDYERPGTGLLHRRSLNIPPLIEKPLTYQLKPAWWALARLRPLLDQLEPLADGEVPDVLPGRTRYALFRRKEGGKQLLVAWRNGPLGGLSLAGTGLQVEAAEDVFGSVVAAESGWYPVGTVPVLLTLAPGKEAAAEALQRLQVRDGAEGAWPQRVLANFTPATGAAAGYQQTGGKPTVLTGANVGGEAGSWAGVEFAGGGSETFRVRVPAGAGVVLRKRFQLDQTGFEAEVRVNGTTVGRWDLRHAGAGLNEGLREAEFVIAAEALAGKPEAEIVVHYATRATSAGWTVLEYRGGTFPLSALGPLHANQNVGRPRIARNMIGSPLRIGQTGFENGLGVFANSLVEYSVNGQFKKFRTKYGIDAATDGRGSVVFEVWGDGKKLWNSTLVSGFDPVRDAAVDIAGVKRLRLVVTDAGDGNRFDAADWAEAVLER